VPHTHRTVLATLAAAALGAASVTSAGAGTSAPDTPTVETGTFRALSYNVAGLPEPLSGSDSDVNSPLISPLLNGYDLVLLQEDWVDPDPPLAGIDFHHDDIVSAVTHPYRSVPAPPPLGTDPRRPTALVADGLNLLSVFPFGEVRRVMWDGCFGGPDTSDGGAGDCLSQKGFMVTTVSLAPGVEVDVYNLHAEAGATRTDQDLSAAQFDQLADYIETNSAGRAVVLGGDTNLHTDDTHPDSWGEDGSIWRRFLERTGLRDVCDVVRCGDDGHSIDKFAFRSGGGLTLEPRSHRFERDVFVRPSDGQPLSDHDALRVDFTWSAPHRPATTTATTATPREPAPAAVVTPRLTG
jgi:hypothetical protein